MTEIKVYFTPEWERALREYAALENRSLSGLIRHATIVWMRRNHGKRVQVPDCPKD